jgi:hypothetical protein
MAPKSNPSFNHSLFGTVNALGKKIPKKRNMKAIIQAQRRIFSPYQSGNKLIIVKKIAKAKAKLRSLLVLILK